MTDLISNIKMGVDSSGVEAGVSNVKRSLSSLRKTTTDATQEMADGFRVFGNESQKASQKTDDSTQKAERATKRLAGEIQNAILATQSFGKTASERLQMKIEMKGLDPAVFQPYMDQLRAVEAVQLKANAALQSTQPVMQQLGMSARATAAAMRGVPAQMTDIVTSLQGGQAPMTVLLQQGGQLKDMFGGVGNAAKAMGTYLAGLITPLTTAAAVIAVLGYAYKKGADESDALNLALIKSGSIAGTTTGQLKELAVAMSGSGFSRGQASAALGEVAASGSIARESLQRFAEVALNLDKYVGQPVSKTVDIFKQLADEPTKASLKLSESLHYLSLAQYEQIKSLEDVGNKTDAARIAQEAYASAVKPTIDTYKANLGYLDTALEFYTSKGKRMWDSLTGRGTRVTSEERIADVKARLEQYNGPAPLTKVDLGTAIAGIFDREGVVAGLRKAAEEELNYLERVTQAAKDAASAEASRKRAQEAGITAGIAVAKIEDDGATNQVKMNKALEEYRRQIELVRTANPDSTLLDPKKIAQGEQAIRDKFKDKAASDDYARLTAEITKSIRASDEFLGYSVKLTEADKFRIEMLSKIEESERKGNISKEVANQLRKLELEAEKGIVNVLERKLILKGQDADIANRLQEEADMNEALRQQQIARMNISASLSEMARSTEDSNAQMALELSLLGKTSRERAVSIAQFKTELELRSELEKIDSTTYDTAADREFARQQARAAIYAKGSAAIRQIEIAEFQKVSDSITQGLTDAFLNAVDAGKNIFESFTKELERQFKNLVLRPIVSAVMSPVGVATAALLNPGAAAAAQGGSGTLTTFKDLALTGKAWLTDFGGQFAQSLNTIGQKLYDLGFEKIGGGLLDATNQAGAFSTIADYANAAGNALGYLNAAVQLSQGKVGAALGAGIGTYFGGPIGSMIGSAVGGWIDNAFGGGREYTTGTGIKGTFSAGSFSGSNYQSWRNDGSSGFFGIGGSGPSSGTNLSALDTATASSLAQSFAQLQVSTGIMATSLGLDAKKIIGFSKDVQVALTNDAAANKKALDAMFSGILDDMALSVAPDIAALSKSSETAGQTLTRLSSSIITANSWLSMLRQRMFQVSLAGADAASKLADVFGGLDKLTEASKAFYDTYFTDAEKVASAQDAMTASLAALGIALPTTKGQFRALVDSLDLTTAGGRQAYATLLQLAPQFAQTADLIDKVATDTAKALLTTFTGNGKLVDVLDATTLSLAGVQKGADVVVGAMTQIHQSMLDVNSPVLTFSGTVAAMSTDLTGAQKSALLLQAQIEDLSGASSKAVINLDGLATALAGVDTTTFVATVTAVFEQLSSRITDTINAIGTERVAVRNAAINIIDPTVMSKESIQAGIKGINTTLPSTAALSTANDKLYAAIAKTNSANSALVAANAEVTNAATAKTDLVSLYATKLGELQALGANYSPTGTRITFDSATMGDNAAYKYNAASNTLNPYSFMGLFGYTDTYRLSGASTTYSPNSAGLKADPKYAALTNLLDAGNAKLAEAAKRIADSQTALAAAKTAAATATTDQAAAEVVAKQAAQDYQKALQAFAIDASKSVTKLTSLRTETVKYYEAQKALASLMQTSASNLLATVANYRFSQLSPDAQAASLKGQFGTAYDMAQASQKDGATLATYADKLNATLGPLIDALNATGQGNLISGYLAQAEAVAKLLQDNAPKNYQQDSLAMLGSIDGTLAALDASAQSAERLITDAIKAGSDRTAAGLYAVIAAITGKTIPAFASGGAYGGGLALVGEQGPELINFASPGQVYTASQTAGMFGGNAAVVEELKALRTQVENMSAETRATAISTNKTAKILERVTPDGVSLQTVAAV